MGSLGGSTTRYGLRTRLRIGGPLAAALLLCGCHTALNYAAPEGPRYAGASAAYAPTGPAAGVLRLVSFNVEFALEIDSAIALLTEDDALRDADIVLLQEMDEDGTQRIASALRMAYVYYPAVRSLRTDRDFGNAVLSRWPIVADEKLILPHTARFSGSQRIATAATLRVAGVPVRVYSAHLGTPLEVSGGSRADQLNAILDHASAHPYVVIGGDMNSGSVGEVAVERGYGWPTRDGPRTAPLGRWDHILIRGFEMPESAFTGTVLDSHNASDHRPVWVQVRKPPAG